MPSRATKRGAERTPLEGSWDVLVCGASFAGLAVARELRGTGARVLVIDRYEVGERQTSACAAPTEWLVNLGLEGAVRQTFRDLVLHTPGADVRWRLPWTFSTFDYRELCALLDAQSDAAFETAKVDGRTGHTVHTDRGDLTRAARRRRAGLAARPVGRRRADPAARGPALARPGGPPAAPAPTTSSCGSIRSTCAPATAGPSPPGTSCASASARSTRATTSRSRRSPSPATCRWRPSATRATGSRTRCATAVEDGVFFAGDSAGHCLPTTAEGIRTALFFGLACGRELRAVVEGRQSRERALARYAAFCEERRNAFDWLLRVQSLVSRVNPTPLMGPIVRAMDRRRFLRWSFDHYLDIAPPSFALEGGLAAPRGEHEALAQAS